MSQVPKKTKTVALSPTIRELLENRPVGMSATLCQAIINAGADDSLILKALKRRMALPPSKEANSHRMTFTRDPRIDRHVIDLAERTRLGQEEIIRLALEAYLHRL